MNNNEPCFACEKPVNVKRPHWMVEVLTDDLGWFPVGPECRKTIANTQNGIIRFGSVERWNGNG